MKRCLSIFEGGSLLKWVVVSSIRDGDGRVSLSSAMKFLLPDDPVRVSIGFYNCRVAYILIVMI
jgi:hypothetical protein